MGAPSGTKWGGMCILIPATLIHCQKWLQMAEND